MDSGLALVWCRAQTYHGSCIGCIILKASLIFCRPGPEAPAAPFRCPPC